MLDERLQTAMSLYDSCDLAADIGTDHARLPSALLRSGICRKMILTDISKSALENARTEIHRYHLDSVADLRLGDGLEPILESCDMISVLGMGGRTIENILLRGADHLRGAALLLSAHTDLDRVRRTVAELGYHLESETPCLDAGRFYLLLKARPGPEKLTGQELRMGVRLFESNSPVLRPYLLHRYNILSSRLRGLEQANQPNEAFIEETRQDLAYLAEKADIRFTSES